MNRALLRQTRRQRGLSLVELMVALAIGAFLMLGVVTVFLANRDSARLENSLATVQESARAAIDLLRDDLERTQYLGCNTTDVVLTDMTIDTSAATPSNTLEGVRGYERLGNANWQASPALPPDPADPNALPVWTGAVASGGARPGSDVLRLRLNRLLDANLTAAVDSGSANVSIDDNPNCDIEQGSRVILTGCSLTAHLFEVSNSQTCSLTASTNPTSLAFGAPANYQTTINGKYSLQSQVLLFEEVAWYVRDTGRNRNGMDVWALYRRSNGDAAQEMVEGVENMQIEFGQRLVGNPPRMRFIDPSDATLNTGDNYEGVQSVRIALLVQGFDPVRNSDDEANYVLLGDDANKKVVAPGETAVGQGATHSGGNVKRNVFTLLVELRNAPTPI